MSRRLPIAFGLALLLTGCESLTLGDPGPGGGGGGGPLAQFARGLVFIRADDRDVYLADQTDFSTLGRLTNDGNARHPSLSHDAEKVVYVFGSGSSSELRVVPTEGGGEPVTLVPASSNRGTLSTPVFSPDDSKVAFAFDRGGASYIGVVNADGTGLRQVTDGSPSYATPSFYADGQSVLCATGTGLGLNQLARVQLSNGAATTVAAGLGNEASSVANRAVLSPDGSRVAFDGLTASGPARIFLLNVSAQTVTRLTDLGQATASDTFPSWNGNNTVFFNSDTGGTDSAYSVPANADRQSGTLQLGSAVEAWFGP